MCAGEASGTVWNSESKEEWLNILEFPKPAKGLDEQHNITLFTANFTDSLSELISPSKEKENYNTDYLQYRYLQLKG